MKKARKIAAKTQGIFYLTWVDADGFYCRRYTDQRERDKRLSKLYLENERVGSNSEYFACKIRTWDYFPKQTLTDDLLASVLTSKR